MGIMAGLPDAALAFQAAATHELASGPQPEQTPTHSIKFAVIGLDHSHINGITDAMRRSGGELISVYSANPQARWPRFRSAMPG
jgi:hypothetical protein